MSYLGEEKKFHFIITHKSFYKYLTKYLSCGWDKSLIGGL